MKPSVRKKQAKRKKKKTFEKKKEKKKISHTGSLLYPFFFIKWLKYLSKKPTDLKTRSLRIITVRRYNIK